MRGHLPTRREPLADILWQPHEGRFAGLAVDLLTTPATVGELWMVGYLCLRGVRRP